MEYNGKRYMSGLFVYNPRWSNKNVDKSIVSNFKINVDDFIAFLREKEDENGAVYFNLYCKNSRDEPHKHNLYAALNNYVRESKPHRATEVSVKEKEKRDLLDDYNLPK